jgi:hypothetical protein
MFLFTFSVYGRFLLLLILPLPQLLKAVVFFSVLFVMMSSHTTCSSKLKLQGNSNTTRSEFGIGNSATQYVSKSTKKDRNLADTKTMIDDATMDDKNINSIVEMIM